MPLKVGITSSPQSRDHQYNEKSRCRIQAGFVAAPNVDSSGMHISENQAAQYVTLQRGVKRVTLYPY
jgi:hypothetical protein